MNTSTDTATRAEILLARAAFEKRREGKHAMLPSAFNAGIKESEAAIIALDTDAFDVRQRMEPFIDNPHLNQGQRERVMVMRNKLLKVLIDHGFLDGWEIAAKVTDDTQLD